MTEDGVELRDDAAAGGSDDDPQGPAPELTPEQVVEAQTSTIGSTDSADASDEQGAQDRVLRTLFAFAAPAFRRRHGDFEGVAAAMTNPIYRPLVAADTVERGPIDTDGDRAVQKVLARSTDGEDRTYEIVLERQSTGEHEDCWLIAAVDMVYVGESPAFQRRPTVEFDGRAITCEEGATLRDVLLRVEGRSPYNDVSQVANCGGNGLCGTCAVEVCGDVDEPSERERRRLELPPHSGEDDLRLSCRTTVQGDVSVVKHDGVFGQHVAEDDASASSDTEGDR
ncbi:Ferredoxin [Natronoarchaeum philippinense]|uniref:Ferredoxin n=1 Tax=Natronoarchaeum philippinense TaxID=558529 RepID=A0A285N6L2_NATPI|nr:2Fe-2S iron-sulfur cluster-binding protein [Natronoarchaeum philippinense]SNZ03361.1 Ferredoxin [Natronoarchaeum philippinense]